MQALSVKSLEYFLASCPHRVPPFSEVGTKFIRLAILLHTLCTAPAVLCYWGLLRWERLLSESLIYMPASISNPFCPSNSPGFCGKEICVIWCQCSSTALHHLLICPWMDMNIYTYIHIYTHIKLYIWRYIHILLNQLFSKLFLLLNLSPQCLGLSLHATSLLQKEMNHVTVANSQGSFSSHWNVWPPKSISEPCFCMTLPFGSMGEPLKPSCVWSRFSYLGGTAFAQ